MNARSNWIPAISTRSSAGVDVLVCISDMTDDPQALLAEAEARLIKALAATPNNAYAHLFIGRSVSGDLSGSAKRRGTGAGAGDRPEFGRGASADGLRACLHGQGAGSGGSCAGSIAPEPARRDDLRVVPGCRLGEDASRRIRRSRGVAEKSIDANRNRPLAFFLLGACLAHLGRIDEARGR